MRLAVSVMSTFLLLASAAAAQQGGGMPTGLAASIQTGYNNVKMNVTQSADKLGNADYGFKVGTMPETRTAGGHAMAAARDMTGAPRHAAYAAGQAAVVSHFAAHELGAAAYAIKAARAAAPEGEGESAARLECRWQRDQLPEAIRDLVLDDQRLRNDICWSVFDC